MRRLLNRLTHQKHLKALPGSENVKNHYKDYVVTDVKDNKGFTHYTLQPKVGNVFAPDEEVKVHVNTEGKVVLINVTLMRRR